MSDEPNAGASVVVEDEGEGDFANVLIFLGVVLVIILLVRVLVVERQVRAFRDELDEDLDELGAEGED